MKKAMPAMKKAAPAKMAVAITPKAAARIRAMAKGCK